MREGTPPLSEALDIFLADVGIRLARHTSRTYRFRLRSLRAHDWPLTSAVCRSLVSDHMQLYQPSTVRVFAGALKAFVKFCRNEGWILDDPTAHLAYPNPPPKPHRYLPPTALRSVLSACRGEKEYAAISLLNLGLRASECLSVRVEDIDDGLLLVKGKGSKYRYVPLPKEIVLPASGRIVPFTYSTLQYRLKQIGKRAGIPHLHAHLFRHSFASNMIEETDMLTVQVVGGWSDDRMLRHYTRSAIQKAAARKMQRLLDQPLDGGGG